MEAALGRSTPGNATYRSSPLFLSPFLTSFSLFLSLFFFFLLLLFDQRPFDIYLLFAIKIAFRICFSTIVDAKRKRRRIRYIIIAGIPERGKVFLSVDLVSYQRDLGGIGLNVARSFLSIALLTNPRVPTSSLLPPAFLSQNSFPREA